MTSVAAPPRPQEQSHSTAEAPVQATPEQRTDRYVVSVEEYRLFRQQGFLSVRGLVSPAEIAELEQHTDDMMQGRLPQQQTQMKERDVSRDGGVTVQGLEAPPAHLSPVEKAQHFLRIHMLHRKMELHERYLLHPRVLDVLQALIGPDVLAMQSMLFLKPPGKPGQGWHQDSFYIPTHPDSLCGAWICIDGADELNGAMWMAAGSQVEPIYPPATGYGHGDRQLSDIAYVAGVSDPEDSHNDLARVADRYPQLLVTARPGDVVFFGGHVLHRSKQNFTTDRFRRSFVGHYCNARSFTQWGADSPDPNDPHAAWKIDPITRMTNGSHILARGDTHLPFALPRFGVPCAALLSPEERREQSEYAAAMMADMASGTMQSSPADPDVPHDDGAGGY
jgi:phytanoyl-CoA hydroxylase